MTSLGFIQGGQQPDNFRVYTGLASMTTLGFIQGGRQLDEGILAQQVRQELICQFARCKVLFL